MTENETAFRHVVEAELQDQERPAHAVAYAGAVTEAVLRSQLAGGGVFTEQLIEVLAADRRAEYAANELGVMACLVAETWVVEQWEVIAARAEVTELPTPLTVTEEQHRRAAIALAAELRDLPRTPRAPP